MAERDDSCGGGFESGNRSVRGEGMSARCDECQTNSLANRRRAKVLRGPLRGLRGMVCNHCIAKREPATAGAA